nr:transcription factor grauzone-like [Aedes albopictus]
MDSVNCFTCGQKPTKFYSIANAADAESKLNISLVMCQHFWFQEADLRDAIICEPCWESVDQFHQFYQDVKRLHEQRLELILIKEETNGIEEPSEENCQDAEDTSFEMIECKPEIEANASGSPKLRKGRKAAKRGTSVENSEEVKSVGKRVIVPPEQRKVEDDFIKQHKTYICEECFERFDDFLTIRKHKIDVHEKQYITCCNKQFRTRAFLYQHVQVVLNPELFKCDVCDRKFKSQITYDRHKENHHPDEHQSVFRCQRCPKSFAQQKILDVHMAEHETLDNEDAKCETCDKCFRSQAGLKAHIDTVHQRRINYVCEYCSKGFNRKTDFTDHRKRHELTADQMKKQCPVCNKLVKNTKYWKRHMDRHRTEGSHKCDHCGHVSNNLLSLKEHMEKRHGSKGKRYSCDQCGKEFARLVPLKEHISTAHTGEPLYQCPYCERKFFSNVTMYVHKKKDHLPEWLEDRKAKYAGSEPSGC